MSLQEDQDKGRGNFFKGGETKRGTKRKTRSMNWEASSAEEWADQGEPGAQATIEQGEDESGGGVLAQ